LPKKAFVVPGDIVLTGASARRLHLCCISVLPCAQAELDHGVDADDFPDTYRTDAVAEDNGLDRFVVSPRRNNLDFAQQERGIEHRR